MQVAHLHNAARALSSPSRCFQSGQQILAKTTFVSFDIVIKNKSGLSRGSFVRAFTRLQNVCSRFRRIVLQHQRSLPRLHLDGNICPGYNSVMSLIRKYGKGSGVVIELKGIMCSKKWTQAWVELVFTGLRW